MIRLFGLICFLFIAATCIAQNDNTYTPPKWDYQIYLQKPAKQVDQVLYYKSCDPIENKLSDTRKTVIMHNYETGNKVYLRVEYEDGTFEEIVRSPCYIDPIIL